MIAQVATKSKPRGKGTSSANRSPKKFIPKNPARKDIGRNMIETTVKVFMISLVRFEMTDKYVSSVPAIRSRRLSEMSWIRTRWS